MAKIKFDQFIDKAGVESGINSILTLLDSVDKKLKDISVKSQKAININSKKTFKDIKELNQEFEKTNTVFKKQIEVEKEKKKLDEQLRRGTDEQVKGELRLQQARRTQKTILAEQLALENKQLGTLDRILVINKKLRRERGALNLETEKGRKRLKEINLELDKNNKKVTDNSDKLKKQKINVGNYTESINNAAGASGLFGGVLGRLAAIQGTLAALTAKSTVETEVNTAAKVQNAAATATMTTAQNALTIATNLGSKALKLFKVALIGTGIGAIVIALGSLVAFLTRTQSGVDSVSTAFDQLKASVDVIIDRFSQVGEGLTLLFSGDITGGLDLIKNAFVGIGDEIAEDTALAKELSIQLRELTRNQLLFTAEQATELGRAKELLLIAKNKLVNDNERLAAAQEKEQIEIRLAEKQFRLEEKSLALSLDAVEIDAERAGFIEQIKNGQISATEAIAKAEKFTLSSAAGEDALKNIVQNIVNLQNSRNLLLDQQVASTRLISSITRDIATKQAKAQQEEALRAQEFATDQRKTFENRLDAINQRVAAEIKAEKIRVGANIITQQEFISKSAKFQLKADKDRDKLRLEAEKKFQIKFLDPEEKERREIKIQKQIAEAKINQQADDFETEKDFEEFKAKELLKIKVNALARELSVLQDFKLKQGEEETKQEFDLRNEERKAQEEQIKGEIELLEAKFTKEEEITNEALKRQQELTRAATETVAGIVDDAFTKRIESLDRLIDASTDRIDQLQDKAAAGRLDTEESISLETKRRAELEKQRLAEQKRQEQAQAFFTVISTYNAKIAAGESGQQALASTFRDVAVLKSLAQSFSSAYEGTEDTGTGGNLDDKGGKLWMLHPHERVVDRSNNDKLKGISNDELGGIADMYNSGLLKDLMNNDGSAGFDSSAFALNGLHNKELINKLDQINNGINNIPAPDFDSHYNSILRTVETMLKDKNKVTRTTRKIRFN